MFLFGLLKNKVYLYAILIFVFLSLIGVIKCNQKLADKRRMEHNSEKRDKFVEKETDRVKLYQEKEKANLKNVKKVKPGSVKKS